MTDGTTTTQVGGAGPDEDKASPLLFALVGILGIAALALLVLTIWLLWPKSTPGETAQNAAGYPIVPVRSIVGFEGQGGALTDPIGVAFDPQGNVWAADTGNGRVLVFDQQGQLLHNIGEDPQDPGNLVAPYGITFDASTNRAYVADFPQGLIKVYDATSGAFIATWPNADQDKSVFGKSTPFAPFDLSMIDGRIVATAPNGLWFFDQNGSVVGHWGTKIPGPNPGQFNYPDAVAVDQANGQIIVTDSLNKRVIALDTSGTTQWISGTPDAGGSTTGYWQLPRGVAIGPECNIYTVDTFRPSGTGIGDGYIQVLTPGGKLLSAFGADGDSEGFFSFPEHLAYYGPDNLWAIADRAHGRILLFKIAPLPAPDQNLQQLFPKSFLQGPFPAQASPADILPSPSASTSPCPGPTSPTSNFPWWILIVALVVLILIWRAVRRIREDRKNLLDGADVTDGGAAPTVEEPEQGP